MRSDGDPFSDVEVFIPAIAAPTQDDVLLQFDLFRVDAAERLVRAIGEQVERDDELTVDLVAFHEGNVVPRAVRTGLKLFARPGVLLPGLDARLLTSRVGDRLRLRTVLFPDFELPRFASAEVEVLVVVRSAAKLAIPADEEPRFLARFGGSVETALNTAARLMVRERRLGALRTAFERIVAQVAPRVQVTPERIQEYLTLEWDGSEGPKLRQLDLGDAVLARAKEDWFRTTDNIVLAERHLRTASVMLMASEPSTPEQRQQTHQQMVEQLAQRLNVEPEDFASAFEAAPERRRAFEQAVDVLTMTDAVFKRVKVHEASPAALGGQIRASFRG